MRAAAAICLALVAGLAGCGGDPPPTREWTPADHGQPAAPDEASIPQETDPAVASEDPDARAARALWNATCAGCHGRDGRGMGEERPPAARLPDFTSAEWQQSRSDDALAQVIADGRGMMPPFGKQINPQGLSALVRHIRRYAPTPAAAPAPQP